MPEKHTLNLFVALPWDEISVAFIRLRYDDDVNNIHHDEQIDLTPDISHLRRDYPIATNGPRMVQYQLTIFLTDGSLLEGAWRETAENRLMLDRRLVDRRLVQVKTLGGTLTECRLREVRVKLQQREPGSDQIRQEHEMMLTPANDGQPIVPWEFLPGDPPVKTIHYMAMFVENDGFVQRTPWTATNADLLIVHLGSRRITA